MSLLEVEGLTVRIRGERDTVTIVDGVDYNVEEGQVFGVAGESGSGKTMSVLALLQLLPRGAQTTGRATYGGRDLLRLSGRALRRVRGRELAMIFQDPLTSLHPMLTIGRQLSEHVRYHEGLSRSDALGRAIHDVQCLVEFVLLRQIAREEDHRRDARAVFGTKSESSLALGSRGYKWLRG